METRTDKVYAAGSVSLRRAGKLHHIGIGREHAGKSIRMLIHNLNITIIDRETGEILRKLVLNPDQNSQPRGLKPGPPKAHPDAAESKKAATTRTEKLTTPRDIH